VPISREERIPDDRNNVSADDSTALIVEDDPHYARLLLGLARDKGFKGLVATRGCEAIGLARQYRPAVITLDIFLPDMLGWTVLSKLKLAPETRHIPVQITRSRRKDGTAFPAGPLPISQSPRRPRTLTAPSIA
jgi:CheY-like chemotaxis protein